MKDPELRFSSLLARGLLMDLLCMMFENRIQGELSRPDGSARTDTEIVDAISGANRDQKLAALRELEVSGVLKRDKNTGVLYSARLRELRARNEQQREKGRKSAAKRWDSGNQTDGVNAIRLSASSNQTDEVDAIRLQTNRNQNMGVSVTVSDSVSVSDSDSIPSRGNGFSSLEEKNLSNEVSLVRIPTDQIDSRLVSEFDRWLKFRFAITGTQIPDIRQTDLMMDLLRRGSIEKAIEDIRFSIRISAKNILDSSHDFQKEGKDAKSYGQTIKEKVGI